MKLALNTFIGLVFVLLFISSSSKEDKLAFVERQASFFELRHGSWVLNTWIRKPENLLTIHESFKKIGYKNLISEDLLIQNPFLLHGIYINRQAKHLLDSLELTYKLPIIKDRYYREFWQRRKIEKNDSVVFIIIQEINAEISRNTRLPNAPRKVNISYVNDTLVKLLEIEFRKDIISENLAIKDFETLRGFGFHQSAFNLLYETTKYQNLKWNKDSLAKTLNQSETFVYPWFQDDNK